MATDAKEVRERIDKTIIANFPPKCSQIISRKLPNPIPISIESKEHFEAEIKQTLQGLSKNGPEKYLTDSGESALYFIDSFWWLSEGCKDGLSALTFDKPLKSEFIPEGLSSEKTSINLDSEDVIGHHKIIVGHEVSHWVHYLTILNPKECLSKLNEIEDCLLSKFPFGPWPNSMSLLRSTEDSFSEFKEDFADLFGSQGGDGARCDNLGFYLRVQGFFEKEPKKHSNLIFRELHRLSLIDQQPPLEV